MFRVVCIAVAVVCGLSQPKGVLAGELKLTPGDEISVSVLNRSEFDGSFVIRPDGAISMHQLGGVKAAGLSVAELEERLASLFQAQSELPVSILVAVERWKPVFVLGETQSPGVFEFMPELTVQQALALSGGLVRRTTDDFSNLEFRIADERARIKALQLRLEELNGRRDRLQRQLDEQTGAELVAGVDSPIIEEQKLILESKSQSIAARIASEEETIGLAAEEIEALALQQKLLSDQIDAQEEIITDTRALINRGLTNINRLTEAERGLREDRIELMLAQTQEIRARQNLATAKNAISELMNDQQLETHEELATVNSEIRNSEQAIESARAFIRSFQGVVLTAAPEVDAFVPVYLITRKIDGVSTRVEVDATTEMLPGDTLEVVLKPEEQG